MKRYYFIFVWLFLVSSNTFAQRHGVYAGAGFDFTIAGNLYSLQTGVELNRHRLGFLYESRMDYQSSPYSKAYNFKALLYEFNFYREKHLHVGLLLRGGFTNDQFVVVVPALSLGYIFNDYWKINMVSGIRAEKPAIAFNLFFNLPFKKNEFKSYKQSYHSNH
jgi:hypothetical protein